MLQIIQNLLKILASVLELKLKNYHFDLLEKMDSRLDSLEKKRDKYRLSLDFENQKMADNLNYEIIEEKKKLKIVKESLIFEKSSICDK